MLCFDVTWCNDVTSVLFCKMASSSCSSSSDSNSFSSDRSFSDEDIREASSVVEPFRFEPPGRGESEEVVASVGNEAQNERANNTDWCLCGFCQIMDRNQEFICCQEIEAVKSLNIQAEKTCITQHPGFSPVCLNSHVLRTAWFQYRQQYGNKAFDGPEHKKNRHVAYRQFVRWCWGFLGQEIRVALPSCAVSCIRAHFPPPGHEDHFVFTGFLFGDE